MGCHDTVASVVSGTVRYAQLMCVSALSIGAQTSGNEEREHSD